MAKSSKVSSKASDNFDSRTCYTESRSTSGFHHSKKEAGHTPSIKPVRLRKKLILLISKVDPAPYELGKVYIGPNEWFVQYRYFDQTTGKYVRDKARLYKRNLSDSQKKYFLNILCRDFNEVLKDRNRKGLYHSQLINESEGEYDYNINVSSSLQFVKNSNDEDLSKDRLACLQETIKILNLFFEENEILSSTTIIKIDKVFLKNFINWCRFKKKSGKTINKYLTTIQFASEWLKDNKYTTESISTIQQRVSQPKNETGRFPPLTHQEKLQAFNYFAEVDINYHHFLFWEYYTCIRGSETYRVKRKDIDFENKTIKMDWLDTKNGLSNYIQLLKPLHDLMIKLGIDKLQPDLYIFGAKFLPSIEKYQGPQSSNKWFNHRNNMKMPKEKQAYGLKHTFNVDYVEQNKYNLDWEWLRRHNRHATVQQTQQYISTLTAYFIDETKNVILNYNS